MPIYNYTVRNIKGELQHGIKEAKDEHALAEFLKSNNLILTSLKEQKELVRLGGSSLLKRVSLTERMLFTRHLAVMMRSGISIMAALNVLSEQSKNAYFKKAIFDVRGYVEQGNSLAEGMGNYKNIFGDLYINMISIGEISGNLEQVLGLLSVQMKKEHELLSKVRGALVYPSVIFVALIGVGLVMLFYVMPKLFKVFEEMNADLPFLTQVIITGSGFIIDNWWIIPAMAISIAAMFFFGARVPRVKLFWNMVFFHVPLVGALIKKTNIARVTRTLNSLLESGVSIVKAIYTTGNTVTNIRYKESLEYAGKEVEKGVVLSKSLEAYGDLYPLLVVQMIKVGEETGNLSSLLGEVADFYEDEVDQISKNLSTIIEPFLMVFIGTAIGFFAVAMIQPMYSMMDSI